MTKKPDSTAKRTDDSTGQWRSAVEASDLDREGVLAKIGTPDGLTVDKTGTWAADPYNHKTLEQTDPPKRRSLDDMRRLSDAIKQNAKWAPESQPAGFFERLGALRSDLECALKGVDALFEEALLQQGMHDLAEQLRNATNHIENALDELMPSDDAPGG
jgi:hypothetical protein